MAEILFLLRENLHAMGVGNDLFDNAKSIRRILCPAENSWGSYPEILSNVKKVVAENRDALYI